MLEPNAYIKDGKMSRGYKEALFFFKPDSTSAAKVHVPGAGERFRDVF